MITNFETINYMKRITQFLIALLLLTSCEHKKATEQQVNSAEQSASTLNKKTIAISESMYKIISEKENVNPKFGINKCNIEVELKEKITAEELTAIANKIRETRMSYDKLWIFYNLPGMTSGSGAWATTHFTPDLKVEILGTTAATDKKLSSLKTDGEVIGKWQDARPYANCILVIYKKNKKIFMKQTFSDGSSGKEEFIKKKFKGKTRYEPKKNTERIYYLVESNGNLSMYGNDGKFGDALKTN